MYITNVRGFQVHSTVCPTGLTDHFLRFADGTACNLNTRQPLSSDAKFVGPDDEQFVPQGTAPNPAQTIINVVEAGGFAMLQTVGGGATATSHDGKFQVNIGQVGPGQGIMEGKGGVQVNYFD